MPSLGKLPRTSDELIVVADVIVEVVTHYDSTVNCLVGIIATATSYWFCASIGTDWTTASDYGYANEIGIHC